jgi:predicted O-linked N-acetylglucosamine transferase (SPINDLY family)
MKPGRNDPCPCGSGKKYKQCCGAEGRPHAAPVDVPQLVQSALAYHQSGMLEQAEAMYRQALALKPANTDALHLLAALVYQSGRLSEASELLHKAIARVPGQADLHNTLGSVLKDQGRFEEAEASLRRAVALKPDFAQAHNNMGLALQGQGRLVEAVACHQRALTLNPDSASAHYNLGNALKDQGQLQEAVVSYRQAITLAPQTLEAHVNLGGVLTDLGRLEEASACFRRALEIKPDSAAAHSSWLFLHNYLDGYDPEALFADHLEWARRHAAPRTAAAMTHDNDRSPTRPLRIGYVSGDLRDHSVAYFLEPMLEHHDHGRFEIFCYSNGTRTDEVTRCLQQHADHWRSIADRSDAQAEAMIRDDRIDILVDLSGHSAANRLPLFARKPAPIQATWIGYPNTTGMTAMDYRLTDARADPPGSSDRLHSETLVRLPRSFLCYRPSPCSPAVAPLPAIVAGYITFGSFNNLPKMTPQVVALWARILAAVPGARLLLKSGAFSDAEARNRCMAQFAEHGIAAERIALTGKIAAVSGLWNYTTKSISAWIRSLTTAPLPPARRCGWGFR